MRPIIATLIVTAAAACAPAPDPGLMSLDLDPFEAIDLTAPIDVGLLFAANERVPFSCESAWLDRVDFQVKDGVLDVNAATDPLGEPVGDPTVDCMADLRMSSVSRVDVSGSARLHSPADLAQHIDEITVSGDGIVQLATAGTDSLHVALAKLGEVEVGYRLGGVRAWDELSVAHDGDGDARLRDIDVETVTVDMTGEGHTFIDGVAEQVVIAHDGSGTMGGCDLEVAEAEVNLGAGSTTVLTVLDRVSGTVESGATLVLHGNPVDDLIVEEGAKVVRR